MEISFNLCFWKNVNNVITCANKGRGLEHGGYGKSQVSYKK